MTIRHKGIIGVVAICCAMAAHAEDAPKSSTSDAPIEISSDVLDVVQAEHKAIFTGNVIATQGVNKIRSTKMIVFYVDESKKTATPAGGESDSGIERIDAVGEVVFTTPTEIAQGDLAIYKVAANTIDLTGRDVTLTRGQNVLKGTALNYNITTGRSILTGGKGKSRVHGLFVPQSSKAKAGTP